MRHAPALRVLATAASLCALLACDTRQPTPSSPPAAPAYGAPIPTPIPVPPAPTPVPQEPPNLQEPVRYQLCVDAPVTPLTPEMQAKQRAWVSQAIRTSRDRHISAIIIDKTDYTLHLYERGERTRSYPLQLGLDPVYDKVREHDCRTPEGSYRIVRMLRSPRTSYTHAFLINYPNADDEAEFDTMRNRTYQIPLTATIGNNIRIHGGGVDARGDSQEGWNWTKGCVALSTTNIIDLAKRVRVGTPVTIVRELSR